MLISLVPDRIPARRAALCPMVSARALLEGIGNPEVPQREGFCGEKDKH